MSKRIVIIGNGISGITCARHIRRNSDHTVTVISGETDHFFSRTALMYIYMGHMAYENTKPYEDEFWERNHINLMRAWVTGVEYETKTITLDSGEGVEYDELVFALGARPNMFGWPGQDLNGVQGMVSYQDLQLMEQSTKGINEAVVIGGGLIGVEMVEMLMSRGIKVHFLVRELKFWDRILPPEEADMIGSHIREHHIDLRLQTEMTEILDDGAGGVKGVLTTTGEEISCQYVGICVGVHPNIGWLKDTGLECEKGILVNEYMEASQPGVYAIGDCAQHRNPPPNRPPIEQVWYTGRMHGETVAQTICGSRMQYQPGNWFNSAKLFDIEYQVYSEPVFTPTVREEHEHLFWRHTDNKHSVRIVYEKSSKRVIYISTLGIRYRHNVCDRWLKEKKDIEYVLQHLSDVNFDPEFFQQYEEAVVDQYNQNTGSQLRLKKKSWQRILA